MATWVVLCLLVPLNGVPGPVRHERPLADSLELSVSTDRTAYYAKEPVRLTITIRNQGSDPVRGFFYLEPSKGLTEIYYRRAGSPFTRFAYPTPPGTIAGTAIMHVIIDDFLTPRMLKPAEAASYETVTALDAATHAFVLQEPGEYEIKVIYRDLPNDPNAVLSSSAVTVQVSAASDWEYQAATEFSEEIALLAQFDPHRYNPFAAETAGHAARFLERHPGSVYAEHLRQGLWLGLRDRVARQRATKEEQQLYHKLQAERPPSP